MQFFVNTAMNGSLHTHDFAISNSATVTNINSSNSNNHNSNSACQNVQTHHHQQNVERKTKNWKLVVDPFFKKGMQKVYRYDGVVPGVSFLKSLNPFWVVLNYSLHFRKRESILQFKFGIQEQTKFLFCGQGRKLPN